VILGENLLDDPAPRLKILTKTLRSPLQEFEKRFHKNLSSLPQNRFQGLQPLLQYGNAQSLPLYDNTVDLIVTSPPYASNAIDYMRAHKFSLAWLGYPIDELGQKRRKYIGGESVADFVFEELPDYTTNIVTELAKVDDKKGTVLHRYYSEMTRAMQEMFRVLKSGKVAIVVVGNSIMRDIDTETGACLADIGQSAGFKVPQIGVRQLDRDKRMLPAGSKINLKSQIQQRMHEEYVIGLVKP
jgi:DNA modification methylase